MILTVSCKISVGHAAEVANSRLYEGAASRSLLGSFETTWDDATQQAKNIADGLRNTDWLTIWVDMGSLFRKILISPDFEINLEDPISSLPYVIVIHTEQL